MDFMNTYPVKKYLHLADAGSHQLDPSRYVFLWHPDIYRELFETAFLAASEGFLLPDHPILKTFTNTVISRLGLLKTGLTSLFH